MVNFSQLCRSLGYSHSGSSQSNLAKRVRRAAIDISHFTGRSTYKTYPSSNKKAPSGYFIKKETNSSRVSGATLRRALIYIGRAYKCQICSVAASWNNLPITLHVDHIDGDFTNNLLENLRFLCPNCHSQTATYCRGLQGTKVSEIALFKLLSRTRQNPFDAHDYCLNPKKPQTEKQSLNQERKKVKQALIAKERLAKIRLSDINVSKFGWVTKVARLLEMRPQKVNLWIKRHAPELYDTKCFKRQVEVMTTHV